MEYLQKNLFLIFQGRFPSEQAASLFAAKSAEAFSKEGCNVTVLVPRRFGRIKESPSSFYGVKNNFKVTFLPIIDLSRIPFINFCAFSVTHLSFGISCLFFLKKHAGEDDIIYSNETIPLLIPSFFFKNTLYEMHNYPERNIFMYHELFKRVRWILAHNRWKEKRLVQQFKLPKEKVFYEPNAVEIGDFNISLSKAEARDCLGLPPEQNTIVYTGHLYRWKGVDTLAHAAELLSGKTVIYFVGGTDTDVKRFTQKYGSVENIKIVGYRPHAEIPLWQKAADVLVLPNTAKENISKYYTSPMKLFEYMASKRPIVASDIPSVTEIVSEKSALLVAPDNPSALAQGIKRALSDDALVSRITTQAFRDVEEHSWDKRAHRILSAMR